MQCLSITSTEEILIRNIIRDYMRDVCPGTRNSEKQLLFQKQPPDMFYNKRCSWKLRKVHRKTSVPESLFKNETLVQVFSCEFCEIFKNTILTKQLRVTVSGIFTCYLSIHMKNNTLIRFNHGWIVTIKIFTCWPWKMLLSSKTFLLFRKAFYNFNQCRNNYS